MNSQQVGIIAFFILCLGFGCNQKPQQVPVVRPNIVLFLVDDLGWQDTSVEFWDQRSETSRHFRTPNLERLAREGMMFTQAYATPVCSPTRISLMTGMNAARHRVTNWTLRPDQIQPMERDHEILDFPFWNVNGLAPDTTLAYSVNATPLPHILQQNGYHTIHVGKAHFGAMGTPGADPMNLGFMVNIGGHAAGAPQSYYGLENFGNTPEFKDSPWPVPGLDAYHGQDIFLTEALTQEAIKALENSPGPFFLYMSYYAVHTPIMADHRFVDRYLQMGLDSIEASYASMVESMDHSIGSILDYLENQEKNEETIILFMSDNGGLSAVARGGPPHTHNLPLASGKGSIYEGGIREPMVVKWPGVTTPGVVNDNYLIIEDYFPTILEMAGIDLQQITQTIDGLSFVKMLQDPQPLVQDRALFWHYPNNWGPTGPGIGAFSAIRLGDWKLIYYHLDRRFELFNIPNDIGEKENLAEQQPEVLSELSTVLSDHLRQVSAQMPRYKATGRTVPFPDQAVLSIQ